MEMKALLCLLLAALPCAAQFSLQSALYPPLLSGVAAPPADTNPPVAGFTLWLHADDTTSLYTNKDTTNIAGGTFATGGQKVGIWLDRSLIAATNHLYQFDGESGGLDRRPSLSNSWFNGKPAVVWPGGALNNQGRLMSLTNNINFGATTNITVLIVAAMYTSGDSFNDFIAWSRNDMFLRRDNTNQKLEFGINNGWITTAGTFTYGTAYCWIGRYYGQNTADTPAPANQSHWDLYRNGNTPDSLNFACCAIQSPNFYALGANGATSPALDQWLAGAISEVVIWPFALTTLQVSNVNYWATNKYNLAP